MPSRPIRSALRIYAALFLLIGLLFVFAEGSVLGWLGRAASFAGAGPVAPGGPSLWLALAGSFMAVMAFLAWRLSEDAWQPAAWEALLLANAGSCALLFLFAATSRNAAFACAALLEGGVLGHLLRLRAAFESEPTAMSPRIAGGHAPFFEVWFARLNDPRTKRALWLRYTVFQRERGRETACLAVFFDPAAKRVESRRWKGPQGGNDPVVPFRMNHSAIAPTLLEGSGPQASWSLRWEPGPCPPVPVVPAWLRALGLTRSGYEDAAPAAAFSGTAALGEERWDFEKAFGGIGHFWGMRFGRGWWWAHAVFDPGGPSPTVFEILSAPGPFGLRATSASLWRGGRLLVSSCPARLVLNRSRLAGDEWRFSVRFSGVRAEGTCKLGAAASLDYEGPLGERRVCRNSTVSPLRVTLLEGERTEVLETEAAAVEFVEAP